MAASGRASRQTIGDRPSNNWPRMTSRSTPADRTRDLLAVAVELAATVGWRSLTREQIATAAGVSPGLVSARLGTMDALRRSVMRQAVTQRCVPVVAQGLAMKDRQAMRADETLRAEAAAWVGGNEA
jgi:AcrR family transcriptional regulator